MADNTKDILQKLVSFRTITGNQEACKEAIDYIEGFLVACGLHVERYEWNGHQSLLAQTRKTLTPRACMFGHIDVVPAPEDQFELKETDDKLYGRGTLDMKGPLAAFLTTAETLHKDDVDYDYAILITSDEETSGNNGAKHIADMGFRPDVMIIPDGGANWNMEKAAKGVWHFTITATGKSAHGSRPWEGINAIETLMVAASEIKQLFSPNPSNQTNTVNIGTISGGSATNMIPDRAQASIDARFMNDKEYRDITTKVYEIAEKHRLKVDSQLTGKPMHNDQQHPLLAAYAKHTEIVTGHQVDYVISNGSNDGRYFAANGVPCAIAYPPGNNHHTNDGEYIEARALTQMTNLLTSYIRDICQQK